MSTLRLFPDQIVHIAAKRPGVDWVQRDPYEPRRFVLGAAGKIGTFVIGWDQDLSVVEREVDTLVQALSGMGEYETMKFNFDGTEVHIHTPPGVAVSMSLSTASHLSISVTPPGQPSSFYFERIPPSATAAQIQAGIDNWLSTIPGMWGVHGVPSQPPPPPKRFFKAGDANPDPCKKCQSKRGRIIEKERILVRFCMLCGHESSL